MVDYWQLPDDVIEYIWSRVRLSFGDRYRKRMRAVHDDVVAIGKDAMCESLMTREAKAVRRATEVIEYIVCHCGAYYCRLCETAVPVDEAESEFCLCMAICVGCKGTFSKCEACEEQIASVAKEYDEFE